MKEEIKEMKEEIKKEKKEEIKKEMKEEVKKEETKKEKKQKKQEEVEMDEKKAKRIIYNEMMKKTREIEEPKKVSDLAQEKLKTYFQQPLKDRREKYPRYSRYVPIEKVKKWEKFYPEIKDTVDPRFLLQQKFPVNQTLNNKVAIWRGDITTLEIDAIVNAANSSLLGGGGVDGAIHSAAGSGLRKENATLGGCRTGEAKLSTGHKMPCGFVLSTVGPIGEDPDALESCYKESLDLLKEVELKSIGFCCISTGIFGYPNRNAAEVALQTTREWMEKNHEKIDLIIFVIFLPVDWTIYTHLMPQYFPVEDLDHLQKKFSAQKIEKIQKNQEKKKQKEKEKLEKQKLKERKEWEKRMKKEIEIEKKQKAKMLKQQSQNQDKFETKKAIPHLQPDKLPKINQVEEKKDIKVEEKKDMKVEEKKDIKVEEKKDIKVEEKKVEEKVDKQDIKVEEKKDMKVEEKKDIKVEEKKVEEKVDKQDIKVEEKKDIKVEEKKVEEKVDKQDIKVEEKKDIKVEEKVDKQDMKVEEKKDMKVEEKVDKQDMKVEEKNRNILGETSKDAA
ncbi:adp-ribose glycohydrolase macrod2 [Anaeramoeba ignava]|uniref:Adp-ribose glycohydrolase macrod2 n=1 Tax=Anaeramoeba ignava TaxID=1746090 RepID=A0A9Q0R970_ANAIG|nr:adp-ribose glycohydrolase macrod2 [Anaeramoeba ignava]